LDREAEKKLVAEHAVRYVRDQTVIGLGSGTTSQHFIRALADRVRVERLAISGVATSRASAELARELGIEVKDIGDVTHIDLYVDGADEISPSGAMIKGGGGALLHEKIVAANSQQRVYIADSSKLVAVLGRFPLAVEVVPFGHQFTAQHLRELGAEPVLRITDEGHYVYDCKFGEISDPARLDRELHEIPGVVETGLFLGLGGLLVTITGGTIVERRF
jgi:ribose 5-phosphate isomerase A